MNTSSPMRSASTVARRIRSLSAEATAVVRGDPAVLDELLRFADGRGALRAVAWLERSHGLRVRSILRITPRIQGWEQELLMPILTNVVGELLEECSDEEQ